MKTLDMNLITSEQRKSDSMIICYHVTFQHQILRNKFSKIVRKHNVLSWRSKLG